MVKKRYHHGNLREALVEAALELVEEHGVEGFTLSAASRTIGVTHAAAYKHFTDKAALLHAVSDVGMAAFGDALDAAFASHTDPESQYLATGRAVVAFARARPHLYQLAFGSVRRDDLDTLAAPPRGSALARFVAMIASWQDQGFLKPGPPARWGLVLWASAHGLAMLVATGRIDVGPAEADALVEDLLRHVHAGIGQTGRGSVGA